MTFIDTSANTHDVLTQYEFGAVFIRPILASFVFIVSSFIWIFSFHIICSVFWLRVYLFVFSFHHSLNLILLLLHLFELARQKGRDCPCLYLCCRDFWTGILKSSWGPICIKKMCFLNDPFICICNFDCFDADFLHPHDHDEYFSNLKMWDEYLRDFWLGTFNGMRLLHEDLSNKTKHN